MHSQALTLSASVLTGAVVTVIMILATLTGFLYIVHPTSAHRLLFLLVSPALIWLTDGPAFYIAIAENQPGVDRSLALILDIAQFIVSIVASLLSGIMPSDWMFDDRREQVVPCFSKSHSQSKIINQSQFFFHFSLRKAPGSSHISREVRSIAKSKRLDQKFPRYVTANWIP